MSDLFSESLGQVVSEQARRRNLARRRQDFLRRLQQRQLAQPPQEPDEGLLDRLTPDILGRAVGQIASTIKETPRGLYELAKAPTLDIKDLLLEQDYTPERSAGLAKSTVTQIAEDVRHPLRNPGYLLLDVASLLPTPAAGVTRAMRTMKAFSAAKRGEHFESARTGLPHGRPSPAEGGEGGALGNEVGLRRDPDVPTRKELEQQELERRLAPARKKYATVEDVKKDFVRMYDTDPTSGAKKPKQHGIVGQMNPFDETGTQYALHKSVRGEYQVLRYPDGKPELEEPVGVVTDNVNEAMKTLFESHVAEAHNVGKFAPEPPEPYTGQKVNEFNEQNRKLIAERERRAEMGEEAPAFADMSPEQKLEQVRQHVINYPDETLSQKRLMEMGLSRGEARSYQSQLYDAGVITKTGKASKKALASMAAETAKLEQSGWKGGTRVTARGELDLDELDAVVRPDLGDDIDPTRLEADAKRVAEDDYEPVELRQTDEGEWYVHSGAQTIAAAREAGVEKLRYEEVEVPRDVTPESAAGREGPVAVAPDDVPDEMLREIEAEQALTDAVSAQKELKKAGKALTPKQMQEIVNSMPVDPSVTPTIAQIQRRLKTAGVVVTAKQATAMRAKFIKDRVDPAERKLVKVGDQPVVRVPEATRKSERPRDAQFRAAERLVYEKGATAKEIAQRLDISESAAKKLKTEVNKERKARGQSILTPHEKAKAKTQIEKIWDEGEKPPTIKAIKEETGLGDVRAKALLSEVAKERGATLKARPSARAAGTSARARELSPRDMGVNPRTLEAAGVPKKFQRSIVERITELHKKVDPVPEKSLMEAFKLTMGAAAGQAAYGRWKTVRGGAREATTGEALRVATKEFFRPNRGGSALVAVVTRTRAKDGRPGKLVTETGEGGEVVSPAITFVDKGDVPNAEQMKLIQRKKLERLPVEVPLSDNVVIKKFQEHRYKWMGKEQSTRVERAYARMIRAGNVGDNSQAVRHIEYQLRELDRAASAIEGGRTIALDKVGLRAALQQEHQQRLEAKRRASNKRRSGLDVAADYADTTNQMAIIATLYTKLGYIPPNLLGQAFLIMADHYLNPLNVLRSMKMRKSVMSMDAETTKRFRQMVKKAMGEGIIGSIEVKTAGKSAKVATAHHAMSHFYSRLMDNWFREISFMNEAHRHGFDTPEKIMSLALKQNQGKMIEITRRANKNIIDFGNMSKTERDVLRRMIFFYPWIKASSLYTARFPTQHPFQAVAITGASREGQKRTEEELGPLPSYLEGAFQGPDINIPGFGNLSKRKMPDGSTQPRIINPAAASVFGSLGQVMDAVKANFLGHVRESEQASDFLSPAVSLAAAVIFRRDPFTGREFPPDMSMLEILKQEATQYSALADTYSDVKRAQKYKSGEADPSEVLFPYTASERIGRYVGGVTPYTLNKKEARSRAFAEERGLSSETKKETMKGSEEREELLSKAKEVGLLPRSATSLPKPVRDAMLLRTRRAANLAAYEEELGRKLKNVDRLYADLSLLVRMKKIPQKAAEAILEQAKNLPDPMVDAIARSIRETHFNGSLISAYRSAVNARLEMAGMEAVG